MVEVIYEDNHLLVVNKPVNILTEPSGTDQENLEDLCKAWLKEKYQKPGNVFLTAAHRIDKPASGVIVMAKTSKALPRIHEAIRSRNCKKTYLARVGKNPPEHAAILEHKLIHDDHFARVSPEGKLARLSYKIIKPKLLEIDLETGRYHQIRVQLAEIGCPIDGDQRYGSTVPFDGIALHHTAIDLPHPITKKMMVFRSVPTWL